MSTTLESAFDAKSFAEVVEQLQSRSALSAEPVRMSSLSSGAAAQPVHEPAYVSPNALSQIYETTLESYGRAKSEPQPTPAAAAVVDPPKPAQMPSVKSEDIARELKLRRWHSIEQLLEIRRAFALKNHPDRVTDAVRDAATARMGIANTLIDDAIKAREARS